MWFKNIFKHITFIVVYLSLSLDSEMAFAQIVPKQDIPAEWVKYTFEEYLFDLEVAQNEERLPEADFMKELLNLTYGNLAKKISVNVNANSSMQKQAVNGHSQIVFNSNTELSTTLSLKLVDSRTFYDSKKQEGYVIAFVEKAAARTYYQNEIDQILGKADKALRVSGDYMLSGFKEKALSEINSVLPEFEKVDEIFFWLNSFGFPQGQQEMKLKECIEKEQSLKKRAAELKYATIIFSKGKLYRNGIELSESEIKSFFEGDGSYGRYSSYERWKRAEEELVSGPKRMAAASVVTSLGLSIAAAGIYGLVATNGWPDDDMYRALSIGGTIVGSATGVVIGPICFIGAQSKKAGWAKMENIFLERQSQLSRSRAELNFGPQKYGVGFAIKF